MCKIRAIVTLLLLAGCDVPPGAKDANEAPVVRPEVPLEGVWGWTRTEGKGIAGSYVADPSSVGYSVTFDFVDNQNLITYRNSAVDGRYRYTFSLPQINQDSSVTWGELKLTNTNNNREEELLFWNTSEPDNTVILYLGNYQPWYQGTDNQYVQQFQLKSRHARSGF